MSRGRYRSGLLTESPTAWALAIRVLAIRVLAIGAVLAAGGVAEARPDSRSMTCAAAAAMVAQRGAVVMSTGPNTFDRYVSAVAFCAAAEQLRPEWVATRDQAKCFVGYTCYVPSRDGFGLR